MNQMLVGAINGRKVLSLTYDGLSRIVEPHTYGVSANGSELLRCYQISGMHRNPSGPHDWNLLTVSKIGSLAETGATFSTARPGYRRGDRAMARIYAEL